MSRKYKFLDKDGVYFVSFAVVYWIDLFVRERYNEIFINTLKYYSDSRLELFAYCIMPSHVHMIFRDKHKEPDKLLGNIKRYSSQQLQKAIAEYSQESRKEWLLWMMEQAAIKESNVHKRKLWQHHNQPIVLWSYAVAVQKINYIHNNPVKAGLITDAAAWKYSSAANYEGNKGMIDVMLIER